MFTKEAQEGEEAPEPTEEESEQGPEPLSTLDKDGEVEGGEAWTPIFSSTNSGVKNQVLCQICPRIMSLCQDFSSHVNAIIPARVSAPRDEHKHWPLGVLCCLHATNWLYVPQRIEASLQLKPVPRIHTSLLAKH